MAEADVVEVDRARATCRRLVPVAHADRQLLDGGRVDALQAAQRDHPLLPVDGLHGRRIGVHHGLHVPGTILDRHVQGRRRIARHGPRRWLRPAGTGDGTRE